MYDKDYTKLHRKVTNEKRFFDYESEEYKALRYPSDIAYSESKSALDEVNRLREDLRAAQLRYRVAKQRADETFKPLNDWYRKQSQLQDEWRRQQGEANGE